MSEARVESFETVVGLEVHAQLTTRTKAFCGCVNRYGADPNTLICPVCLGMPGALPVLNRQAVAMALRAAVALDCTPHLTSSFARKHYFYPDLPKGYQITQYDAPLATNGSLRVRSFSPENQLVVDRRVGIVRVHMEEDAGKSVHQSGVSVVDLNRAGTPLIEIVFAPDLRSGEEAAACLRQLRALLMALAVCDGNMEQGSLRCDVNVSVRRKGDESLGTRTEIKNVNSFRFVHRAIDYEAKRQVQVLERGELVTQETRGWDERAGKTFPQRSKEQADDYRYFPEPDLPMLVLDEGWLDELKNAQVELPSAKFERYVGEFGLSPSSASVLTSHVGVSSLFDDVVASGSEPKRAASFIQTEVLRDLVFDGLEANLPVTVQQIAGLLALVAEGTISGKQAKEVYASMRGTNRMASEIVASCGIRRLDDVQQVREACVQVMSEYPMQVEAYRAGKAGLLGFFVGQVMRVTQGSADPRLANELLRELLVAPEP